MKSSISKSERRWVLGFALAAMLLTSIPYILGWTNQTQAWHFTGFYHAIDDGNAYIAKMLTGTTGSWLFRTPYTVFPQNGFLIFLPYILLGKLATNPQPHDQLVLIYHAFRIVAGILLILASFDFIAFFCESPRTRKLGITLVTFGGGLGWFWLAVRGDSLTELPLEFYSPETFGFLSLYIYPHYALARALMLWSVLAFLHALVNVEAGASIQKELWKPTLLWLLTALVQPLTGMITGAVIGIYLFGTLIGQPVSWLHKDHKEWERRWLHIKLCVWAAIIPTSFVLYNLISQRTDPFLAHWTEQSYFGSPPPIQYLLAYGLVLPFVFIGARELWGSGNWAKRLPVLWTIFLPIFIYAPISIQRRLPEGIWVAIVTLTVIGWESVMRTRFKKAGWILGLVFLSTAMILLPSILFEGQLGTPRYRPSEEVAAFNFIAQTAQTADVVLISNDSGNALPAWAPVRVLVGHGNESINYKILLVRIRNFYSSNTSAAERIAFLKEQEVDYVFWGPNEQAYGDWQPESSNYLIPIYHAQGYSVFKVDLP